MVAAQARGRAAAPTAPSRRNADADANAPARAADKATPNRRSLIRQLLPPIESITAATDIRAFLAPGVPEELTRAALRRVWVTDPTIRDFVGLAENQWDFTNPDGVPGFGSLESPRHCAAWWPVCSADARAATAPQPALPRTPNKLLKSPANCPPRRSRDPGQKNAGCRPVARPGRPC